MRKIIFWSHLVVGVTVGLVVFALAVTGALLTYEVQITRWVEHRAGIEASGTPLTADALAEAALAETGGRATALVFENDPAAPVAAIIGREGQVLLDPYSGTAIDDSDSRVGQVFAAVTGLHRWLSVTGFSGAGKAVTGAANLGFLFLALTGAYLWLPKVWRRTMFRVRILFRRYPSAQARDFHWHHIFAFWALIPLIVIIGTGVTMSFERAEGLVMTLVGVGDEEEDAPAQRSSEAGAAPAPAHGAASLDAVLDAAKAYRPDWRRVKLDLPRPAGAETVTAMVDTGPGRQPTRQQTLTFALADASITAVQGYADQPKAVRTFLFLRFGHTGEFFGFVGQTIAGLASLAAGLMVFTGLALAWRRLVSPVLRRRRQRRGA